MTTPIKILIVEHSVYDIDLIRHELRKNEIVHVSRIVQTKEDFESTLFEFEPDIILSDYSLPNYSGLEAFYFKQENTPDIPFIFISGTIGEENIIDLIKKGVTDYVLKDKLYSLQSRFTRALKEAKEHSEKIKVEQKLVKSEQHFRALIENGTDVIGLTDVFGKIIYLSPSYEKNTGFTIAETIGKPAFEIMHPEQAVESRGKLDDVIQNPGVIYQRINRFKCKDGSFIWCEGTVINLLHDENVKAIVSNYRNITDRKLAEEKLKELNDELEGKVEQRTQELAQTIKELEMFTYTVSHDLRTPLNAIYGFANLLSEFHKNDLNEEGKEYVWHIVAAAKRMTHLIGDLLHLSKLGKMRIEKSKVDMNALVRKVKYDFEKANQHQAQITIETLPNVDGDASLLEQVWMNLISNAVKYSAKKDCSVVQIGVEYENGSTIFYVKDNGAGFDMNQASKLFGVFQRMHTSSEFEGTGVGLAIVKLIIEKHEGKIWVESKINEGTTFYFSLEDGNGAKNSW
ncbi:MAG: hypothetical protein RI955_1071 [Bacteroidota bacterium]